MKIKVLATGSSGNSYALIDEGGNALIIEAWLNPHTVLENLKNENIRKYAGWCYSHEHGDHFVYNISKQYDMYFGKKISEFAVVSFPLLHDRKHPKFKNSGFVIQTRCRKTILFATDFYEIPEVVLCELEKISFDAILIECSYNNFIYKDFEEEKKAQLKNHCSDDKCVDYVSRICGEKKQTQILTIHKSERGGRAGLILAKFSAAGFQNVRVAVKGTNLNL